MFQAHCYNSWLSPEARKSALYGWSQLVATLPAPLFLFLSGISFALVTERLREKGASRGAIARQTILRGAEIFGLGILFRIQEYALGYQWVPWTDLLRVDVLNIIGLSMVLMGVVCWLTAAQTSGNDLKDSNLQSSNAASRAHAVLRSGQRGIVAAIFAALLIALATPPLWSTHRPKFLSWPVESYINGVHIFDKPQPWLFPIFPWAAFSFAGLAIGFFLFSTTVKRDEKLVFAWLGGAGIFIGVISVLFDRFLPHLYGEYDYWHTSPNFFLIRCGILLMILFFAYVWCRWGLAQKGFSPLLQLGQTSLLVYWVHIEFVYGRFSILPKGQCSVAKASAGLAVIFSAMLMLSLLRTRWKNWKKGTALSAKRKDSAEAVATAGF